MTQRESHLSEDIQAAAIRYIDADFTQTLLMGGGVDEAMAADASGVNGAHDGLLEVVNLAEGKSDTLAAIEAMTDLMKAGIPMSPMAMSRMVQRHARAVAADLS